MVLFNAVFVIDKQHLLVSNNGDLRHVISQQPTTPTQGTAHHITHNAQKSVQDPTGVQGTRPGQQPCQGGQEHRGGDGTGTGDDTSTGDNTEEGSIEDIYTGEGSKISNNLQSIKLQSNINNYT